MIPAEKLPVGSRATIAPPWFAAFAVVAVFATLPAVEIVASFESTIAALGEISAFTIVLSVMSVLVTES